MKPKLLALVAFAVLSTHSSAAQYVFGPSGYEGPPQRDLFEVGNGVSAPVLKSFVAPAFSKEALAARYTSSNVLWLIITSKGKVTDVKVKRSVGIGLDEAAVRAVRQWQFKPAEFKGKPVPVHIDITLHFNANDGTVSAELL